MQTLKQYTSIFQDTCNTLALTDIERSGEFRSANHKVDDKAMQLKTQACAQYGRIKTTAAHILLDSIAHLKPKSVICDPGHGVGNLVIQAAYTMGCEGRGIELVQARHSVAEALLDHFQNHYPVRAKHCRFLNH